MNQLDPMCGGCPVAGSAPHSHLPQGQIVWPGAQPGFPSWPTGLQPAQPMEPAQPSQPQLSQPAGPCWTGQPQPGTPCWPGMQPAPAPAPAPTPDPTPTPAPAPDPATSQAMAPFQLPAQVQNCGVPCWPGTQYQPLQPQYQPLQPQYQPSQPQPQPQPPAPAPAPAPAPTPKPQPQAPGPAPSPSTWNGRSWVPGYHPGQPGWPGQSVWNGQGGWSGGNPGLLPPQWPTPPAAGPLSVPYNLNLARGVYDRMLMTIMGNVKPKAKMFTINFLRGNDIAFHINPRFNDLGKQVLVRNAKVGANWGKEERDLKGPFPFAAGSPFEMKILCTMQGFRVAVNNVPVFEFLHQVKELNQIDRINILHDVILTYINVETLP